MLETKNSQFPTHELPVACQHRGVEIYGLQSDERIQEAKRQVDVVITMSTPAALAAWACDPMNAAESRLLAKHKALRSVEDRQKRAFDVDRLEACTIGLERCTSRLGRLMAYRQAAGT
jgi:hypothetical protein